MRGNLSHFMHVTALDATFGRNKAFPNTIYTECVLDRWKQVHAVSLMCLMTTECTYGWEKHGEHTELSGLLKVLNRNGQVPITDGMSALTSMVDRTRPNAYRLRCQQHIRNELNTKSSANAYELLTSFTPHRLAEAKAFLSKLLKLDKPAHTAITRVDIERHCPAFLPTGELTHYNMCMAHMLSVHYCMLSRCVHPRSVDKHDGRSI